MNYAYEIFRLFYPERCAACGRSLPEGARLLCPRCRWDMPLTGYSAEHDNPVARKFWGLVPVQEACSMIFFTQGNAYRSMIHGFKYRGQWRTALRLGRWFGTELRESGLYGDVDVVVPVPLHYRRLLSRGYNQAEYFGRGIAEALGVPLDARSVVRSGYNRSQARTADRSERWGNVKGIFSVRRPASLAGRHLLLVDAAVLLVIVSAGALAFVVLLNLSSINLTERLRELATLKVLGFYDRELSAYVFRENILLTVFGVLAGLVMGKYLHRWLISTVEIDLMMFGRSAHPLSYLWAALLTVLFSFLTGLLSRRRLRDIDMVESLKTVE